MKFKLAFFSILFCFLNVVQAMEKSDKPTPLCTQLFNKKFDSLSHKTVVNALSLEQMSVNLVKDACNEFLQGKLTQFDANAGDNLCQVRAKLVASTFNDKVSADEVKQILEHLPNTAVIQKEIDEIQETVKAGKQADIKKLNASLKALPSLLADKSIGFVSLSNRTKALVLSNIVTRFHSDIPKERKKKIEEGSAVLGIAANKISDLLKDSRVLLNKLTVEYFDDEAKKSNDSLCIALAQQKEQCGSFAVPSTYGGMVMLLARLNQEQIPVVLKAKVICPDHGTHLVEVNKQNCNNNDLASFVIEGISDPYKIFPPDLSTDDLEEKLAQQNLIEGICPKIEQLKNDIQQLSLQDLVCANVAKHSQFVDKTKNIDFEQLGEYKDLVESQFNNYQQMAMTKGLCKENGALFRIIHMFADLNNKNTK